MRTWRWLLVKEHLACHFETGIAVIREHPFPQALIHSWKSFLRVRGIQLRSREKQAYTGNLA